MTTPALVRSADLRRAADVAQKTGCRVEIKKGDTVITVIPDGKDEKQNGIDYGRPDL